MVKLLTGLYGIATIIIFISAFERILHLGLVKNNGWGIFLCSYFG